MKPILQIIGESGKHPDLPTGLEPAIKLVQPDWTTHSGFSWWQPPKRWIVSDTPFNPEICVEGGLHVANTVYGAQSGGAQITCCLWVGVDPSEAGEWDRDGKRKAKRVYVGGPIDLIGIIRSHGAGVYLTGANLSGAYLSGAYLSWANLSGADLSRVYLTGANLTGANLIGANLSGANLTGANLSGADLSRANLTGANLTGANLTGVYLTGAYLSGADLTRANLTRADLTRAYLSGADLTRADLTRAYLSGADLYGASGRDDWDALVKRGAIR